MKPKPLIIIGLIAGLIWWTVHFFGGGGFERYLDKHPDPQFSAYVEYQWASLMQLSSRTKQAKYHYQKVIDKYPRTKYGPLAMSENIQIVFDTGLLPETIKKCEEFVQKYPDHPRKELMAKRIYTIKNGF